MDPITVIVAGAAAIAGKKVLEQAAVDAYTAVKEKLVARFGAGSSVTTALAQVEEDPEFEPGQAVLARALTKADASTDPEIVAAAAELHRRLEAAPGGTQIIHHVQHSVGNQNVLTGPNSTVHQTIHNHPAR